MGDAAGSGSLLSEWSGCRIRQFAWSGVSGWINHKPNKLDEFLHNFSVIIFCMYYRPLWRTLNIVAERTYFGVLDFQVEV